MEEKMKSIKKLLTLALASALLFTACSSGGTTQTSEEKKDDKKTEQSQTTDSKTLIVGASPSPHAEILKSVAPALEKEGIKLEVKEFTDYIIPNTALEEKQLDANYFQHQPYLDNFQKEHKTHLKSVATIHVEPMAVYSKKIKALSELADGATVAIPNDPTNGGRALILLEKQGLITIKEGVDKLIATDKDVDKNTKNLKFKLLDAAQLPRTLDEVDAAVINTNYALEGGLNPVKDALVIEDKDSPYANVLAVREGEENDERVKALIKALQSDETRKFIEEKYSGAVIPAF